MAPWKNSALETFYSNNKNYYLKNYKIDQKNNRAKERFALLETEEFFHIVLSGLYSVKRYEKLIDSNLSSFLLHSILFCVENESENSKFSFSQNASKTFTLNGEETCLLRLLAFLKEKVTERKVFIDRVLKKLVEKFDGNTKLFEEL